MNDNLDIKFSLLSMYRKFLLFSILSSVWGSLEEKKSFKSVSLLMTMGDLKDILPKHRSLIVLRANFSSFFFNDF